MPKIFICRTCEQPFVEKPAGSPGFINQCLSCSSKEPEPEKIGGNMIYLQKTGGYCELKPLSEAKAFAKKTARFGHGVTKSITESTERGFKRNGPDLPNT